MLTNGDPAYTITGVKNGVVLLAWKKGVLKGDPALIELVKSVVSMAGTG